MPPLTTAARRRLWVAEFAAFLLIVVSVVPWRRGAIFDGGVDSVVIAKAVISVAALGFALLVYRRSTVRGMLGVRSLTLLAAIVAVSTLGALGAGDTSSSLVLVVRIAIVTATVALLIAAAPTSIALQTLVTAMGSVAIVSGVTGAILGTGDGRLAGGIPEMGSNVLAGLAAPAVVALTLDIVRRGIRWSNIAGAVPLLAIIIASGARMTLLVVVVAIAVIVVQAGRLPVSTAIVGILTVPVVYALVAFTDSIAQAISRGQSLDEIATLSSRTVAWEAVLSTPIDTWAKWIGVGLATKLVPVQERWRDEQVLDSSWVSIIAQAGIIGTVLLLVWVIATITDGVRERRVIPLAMPLLVVLAIRSVTESGLIESSPTFVLFLALSLMLERGTRHPAPVRHHAYALARPGANARH